MLEDLALAPFDLPVWASSLLFGLAAALLGGLLTHRGLAACDESDRGWSRKAGVAAGLLTAAFCYVYLRFHCQETPMVRPGALWWHWRIGHHVLLIVLLTAVTATDLRAYLIPDALTLPWIACAIVLAAVSGDLQMQHLWIDWNQEIPQLKEPFVPEWIKRHPHLHGLAWSAAGALFGAGVTWILRCVSSAALGQETMGLGDVTLMGLIGSFLGWQPTVFVLLLAPLLAVAGGLLSSLVKGKTYIPYGPYLAAAAIVVLFNWRWIWMFELSLGAADRRPDRLTTFSIRRLFGDWPSLAIIAAVTLVGLILLLGLRRAYRAIPVTRRRPEAGDAEPLRSPARDPEVPR